ncbi:16S rRNA (guanine(966)-N(2))-methyltransferase RsmD [uncultured Sphaerochaeta sp.]|uniref:16S rRNA (guanine(966)-N(2))-methyltransferase RsmD n=1 Tax=uncultured Sphaerochaeta sp. TaxID=886478 RepID=UPI002A0A5339|nr:16S rRNA (guanine(966)-N(2))-methyltransferase RsmD [uncultured Sphaerochaeta sp.]
MRITGGKYRGRTVLCPPGVIRPAMDSMRESLFGILGNLEGQSWLDLFTGSGCVGIEAASRGASPVHLVEKDHIKKQTILTNISMVDSQIQLFMADVRRFIPTAKRQYDIVYADPPFPMDGKIELAKAVDKANLLTENGLFIIHYPAEEKKDWPKEIGNLFCYDERQYGRSTLRFFVNKKETKKDEA